MTVYVEVHEPPKIVHIDVGADGGTGGGGGGDPEMRVFKASVGDGTATQFTVTHGFALASKLDCTVEVTEISSGQVAFPVVTKTSMNAVKVDFAPTVPTANQFRVIVREA